MKTIVCGLVLACAGCASHPAPPASTNSAYRAALTASRAQPATDVSHYMGPAVLDVIRKHLSTRNGCSRAGSSYHILLRVGATGSVDQMIPREENEITECFREVFRDVRFPAPPFEPFYLELCRGPCPEGG
jgi:hypothetical protein